MLSSQSTGGPNLPSAVAMLGLSAWHCFSHVWDLSTPVYSLPHIPASSPLTSLPGDAGAGAGECFLAQTLQVQGAARKIFPAASSPNAEDLLLSKSRIQI